VFCPSDTAMPIFFPVFILSIATVCPFINMSTKQNIWTNSLSTCHFCHKTWN
jgi:hypothetical protein